MSKMKKMFKLGSKKHVDPAEWTKSDDKMVAAVQADDLEKIEQLMVKKGVIPTKISPQGFTALHLAALEGRLPIVRLFQEKDVELTILDHSGKTPLHCACKGGHLDVIVHLLQMCPETLTSIDHNDLSPLHHACLGGSLPATRHLLHAGCPVSGRDKVGRTPLFIAARLGNLDLCKELLDNHADINHRDFDKRTALMFAAEYEQTQVVEYLVRRGANALLTDSAGNNATWYAKQADNEEIVNILENAPSRASWSLDKSDEEKVEETVVEEGDMVAKFEPLDDDPISAPVAPSRKPKQPPPPPPVKGSLSPPPGFGAPFAEQEPSQMEKLEHGVVPMDEALAEDEYFSGVGSYPFQEPSRDETDNSQFSPEAVAAVEAILQSTSPTTSTALTTSRAPSGERNTHEELRVDPEAFKELEEEHEYLNRELQQVSMEKKHLEDKVQVLERRLSGSDAEDTVRALVAPVQSVIDSTLVESLEEELAEARMQLSEDKDKMGDLEDEVKQLRKQIDIDSKPEAERSADDSWNDSDNDLFESEVCIKKNSSLGLADTAVVATLRSRVLSLEREIEELKSEPKIEGEDRPGSPVKGLLSESGTERDLESLTQYSMLQQAHDSECHQLQERIETLLDENFIIKKQLTSAVEQKLEIASTREDLDMKVEELSHSKSAMERELEHLHGMVEEMQRKSNQPAEFERLKQSIESAKTSTTPQQWSQPANNEQQKLEIQNLKQSLEKSERENERLNSEFNEIHSQVQGLEGLAIFNNELTQENDRLKEEISSLQESMESSSPRDADQKAIAQLTMQLQQENNDLKSENRSLKSEIADIETSLKDTLVQREKERLGGNPVEKENATLKTEIQALKESLGKQKVESYSAASGHADLPPETEELKSQITHLKRTVSQQDETIMELMQQSTRDAQLRYDYERLQKESEMMTSQMMEFQTLFSGQGQESNKRIQDLEQEIQSLLEENAHLKSIPPAQVEVQSSADGKVWESKIAELQQVKEDLEKKKDLLEDQVSSLEVHVNKLEKDAYESASVNQDRATLKEDNLALEVQVAQLATITLQAETSSRKVSQLESEKSTLIQERDELYHDISTWKEEIGKLEAQLSANSPNTADLEKIQEEYNTLTQEKVALERKVIELQLQDNRNEPAYFDLKARVKELEDQLEREQSATVMAILDGRTAEQQSTENDLKEKLLSLTSENDSLKKEIDQLKESRQNGNTEEVMMLSAVSLQSSPHSNPYGQQLNNHRLGSSLKKRSEEFRLKEVEEENERLKTEISKLKLEPYSESHQSAMEKQLLMMQDKLESMERRHRDVVSTYRTHLLRAVKGHMDTEVQHALLHIVKIRQAPEVDV